MSEEKRKQELIKRARIKRAAEVLRHRGVEFSSIYSVAKEMLEAADKEEPNWPTDESMSVLRHVCDINGDADRDRARDAFLVDPIIQAAVELKNRRRDGYDEDAATQRICDAVDEAGL